MTEQQRCENCRWVFVEPDDLNLYCLKSKKKFIYNGLEVTGYGPTNGVSCFKWQAKEVNA